MRERWKRKHYSSLYEVLTLEEAMDLLLDYVKMMKDIVSVVTRVSLLVPGWCISRCDKLVFGDITVRSVHSPIKNTSDNVKAVCLWRNNDYNFSISWVPY